MYGSFFALERASGIEPPSRPWQGRVIATIPRPQCCNNYITMCRGGELNTRPIALQANALPLSYRGMSIEERVDAEGLEPPTPSV